MNYFDAGDLVECTQSLPRYGYVVGHRYTVAISPANAPDTYVPDPGSGWGLACDHPMVLQHFILILRASARATASSAANTAPVTGPLPASQAGAAAPAKVGDWVTILAVDGSGLPPGAIGDNVEVIGIVATGSQVGATKPWIEVDWMGNVATLRDDQYAPLLAPLPAQNPIYGHVPFTVPALGNNVVHRGDEYFCALKSPVCECGSDAAKQPAHSQWCPKFIP